VSFLKAARLSRAIFAQYSRKRWQLLQEMIFW
jgi:hypothetical protein